MSTRVPITDWYIEFGRRHKLGTIEVPRDYHHETYLDTLAQEYSSRDPAFFSQLISDKNFPEGKDILVPGRVFAVAAHEIVRTTGTSNCVEYLKQEKALFLGFRGLRLLCDQISIPEKLLGIRLLSFSGKNKNDKLAERIPYMTCYKNSAFPRYHLAFVGGKRGIGDMLIAFVPL